MARTSGPDNSLPLQFERRGDDSVAGQSEMAEQELYAPGRREARDAEHAHRHGRVAHDDFGDGRAEPALDHCFLDGDDRLCLARRGDDRRLVERLDRRDVENPRMKPTLGERVSRRDTIRPVATIVRPSPSRRTSARPKAKARASSALTDGVLVRLMRRYAGRPADAAQRTAARVCAGSAGTTIARPSIARSQLRSSME